MNKALRIRTFIKSMILAFVKLSAGAGLGLVMLELVLRANPSLLLYGMALPSPKDPPIVVRTYDVHTSDADLYFWSPTQIEPVPPEADRVEAHVRFETDEFGFPNPAPLPAVVDVIVLGRSYSLGANATAPWPRRLGADTGWKVLNLSQAGGGIALKLDYLRQFGLPRQPRWIVVEVLPSMDILGYTTDPPLLIQRIPVPLIQYYARQFRVESPMRSVAPGANVLYPLTVDLQGQTADLLFFDYYLTELTIDSASLAASSQWSDYRRSLLALVNEARSQSVCVALLYAPTREAIYFPLAIHPEQLEPILTGWWPWTLDEHGTLAQFPDTRVAIPQMQANAIAARDLLAGFAREQHLTFIDPVKAMTQAIREGDPPFMTHDSHWSATGHRIVADLTARALMNARCP